MGNMIIDIGGGTVHLRLLISSILDDLIRRSVGISEGGILSLAFIL